MNFPTRPQRLRAPGPETRLLAEIKYEESGLRQRTKEYGGQWYPDRKLWQLSFPAVLALGPKHRVTGKLPVSSTSCRAS